MIDKDVEEIKERVERDNAVKVSVALFGQPGAGKSSLINAIAGKEIAKIGLETDTTIKETTFEINGLDFVDLPGYGTEKFPKEGYFEKFNLAKIDIFLCVTSGKLHADDVGLFKELRSHGKTCIFVFNKTDELWEGETPLEQLKQRKIADISKNVGFEVQVFFTSCRHKSGLVDLQNEIADHLDQAKKERFFKSAMAYSNDFLDKKFKACKKVVLNYSALSAANAINPVPGVDVAVDIGIIYKLFQEIRTCYGLDSVKDETLLEKVKVALPAANRVIAYAAKEGILVLLKSVAGKMVFKTAAKYVPFVGQAIAAMTGFGIIKLAGDSYLEDCHEVAKEFFSKNISS